MRIKLNFNKHKLYTYNLTNIKMYDYKYTIYKEMYNKNERNAKLIYILFIFIYDVSIHLHLLLFYKLMNAIIDDCYYF